MYVTFMELSWGKREKENYREIIIFTSNSSVKFNFF